MKLKGISNEGLQRIAQSLEDFPPEEIELSEEDWNSLDWGYGGGVVSRTNTRVFEDPELRDWVEYIATGQLKSQEIEVFWIVEGKPQEGDLSFENIQRAQLSSRTLWQPNA